MDTLSLYIITWNIAEQMPPHNFDLTDVLSLNKKKDNMPDFYIVGLQEAKVDLLTGLWGAAFKNALKQYNYVEINSVRLLGIVMYVFSRVQHITKVRNMETGSTPTGLLGIIGNKGAVTFRMDVYGVSVCLVNSHLTPHDGSLAERVASYNTILQSRKFKLNPETSSIFFHDYVFWYGDLNFRLRGNTAAKDLSEAVAAGKLDELWKDDELSHVRATGEAFSELQEQRPTFAPTYKLLFNSTTYNTNRRPAWTDRILYKANKDAYQNVTLNVTQESYQSIENNIVGDHNPVYAEFNIKVFSNHSDREVTFESLDTWYLDEDNTAVCHLPADVSPSMWDWVGVFQENLTTLQDYVSYIYVPHHQRTTKNNPEGVDLTLRFPPSAVREPGLYRLLYFTRDGSSLLGLSAPFNAVHRTGNPLNSSLSQERTRSSNSVMSTVFLFSPGLMLIITLFYNKIKDCLSNIL